MNQFTSSLIFLNFSIETKTVDYYAIPGSVRSLNTLGVTLFSLLFGIVLPTLGKRGKIMVDFIQTLNEVSIKIIQLIMW